MDRWQRSEAWMEHIEAEKRGGGLMVNEADGWTANRDKVRKTRWTK